MTVLAVGATRRHPKDTTMIATAIPHHRPRLLLLVLLALVCAAVVGCGLSAASGPQPTDRGAVVDTADRPVEPTGRTYLAAQP
jgi:hypothetical protein